MSTLLLLLVLAIAPSESPKPLKFSKEAHVYVDPDNAIMGTILETDCKDRTYKVRWFNDKKDACWLWFYEFELTPVKE